MSVVNKLRHLVEKPYVEISVYECVDCGVTSGTQGDSCSDCGGQLHETEEYIVTSDYQPGLHR